MDFWQLDIYKQHVGCVLSNCGESLFPVGTFADDLNRIVIFEKAAYGFAGGRLIVSD